MVSTNQAIKIIKEAKGVERNLGASWYTPVTNTVTGNNVMKHVLTVGMPAPNTGWGVDSTNALVSLGVGFVGTGLAFASGRNFLKSQDGGSKANAKHRKRAAFQAVGALAAMAVLSPMGWNASLLTGRPAGSTGTEKRRDVSNLLS